ncbi:hypothetical protein GCM10023322_12440 [Rugosimonospora acidiphila]|uniref:LamG-like jellyroll fold domain-containing protein n=1 Tax=Rugosimonospora acidiphila TaxID=556531 RepID=A0ABP9RLJ1_9ACTN
MLTLMVAIGSAATAGPTFAATSAGSAAPVAVVANDSSKASAPTTSTATANDIAASPAAVGDAQPSSGLLLDYDFENANGSAIPDSSGNGNDGTIHGTAAYEAGPNGEGSALVFPGGPSTTANPTYVSIPNNILQGRTALTVSAWVKWGSASRVNQWLFGLGTDNQKYLFATPGNGSGKLYAAITTGSYQNETGVPATATLPVGSWQQLTFTIDSATGNEAFYLNGAVIGTASTVVTSPNDVYAAASAVAGYIGKSFYSPDPYFQGSIADFEIYDRALTAGEVAVLAGNTTLISAVTLTQLKVPAIITAASGTVVLPVAPGTDPTRLAPEFTLAAGSSISPPSGSTQDFTSPVIYTVTGSDGSTKKWSVKAVALKTPLLPGYNADPNIVVFGDTYYIYPTTDGIANWGSTSFHAFSSKDLVHWTDDGTILRLGTDVTWATANAWAPTLAQRNGKFYFYFVASNNIGVAVGDSPTGPFTDALGRPLIAAGQFAGSAIDPDVFTDTDGSSYLYWGNGTGHVVRLNDDMISFDTSAIHDYKPTGYGEGSFAFKRGGTYYLMWSQNDTRSVDYQVDYATSTSPLGPWTYRGVILRKDVTQGILGTGHDSVVNVPGTDDWYVAYHRFAIPDGDGYHRETTIDRLEFNADGTIKPVVPTLDSIAPEPVPPVSVEPTISSVSIAPGDTVSGDITVSATVVAGADNASSRLSYTYLELNRDGTWLTDNTVAGGSTNNGASPTLVLDTARYPNGTYNLKIDAVAVGGATTERTISFTIGNGPALSFAAPGSEAKVSGTVPVSVQLGGPNLQAYNLRIDGAGLQYAYLPQPGTQSFELNTTTLTNGVHTLLATATNSAGYKTTITERITVNNPPVVRFVAPSNGLTLGGIIPISVSLSGQGLQTYDLQLDATVLQHQSQPQPGMLTFRLNATAWAAGAHTLLATATDSAGNTTAVTEKITIIG